MLCSERRNFLTTDSSGNAWKNIWPSYMWKVYLTSEHLVAQHEDLVWQIFPSVWRKWWLGSLLEFCDGLQHVSLEHPLPLFDDVTEEKNFVQGMLERKKGGKYKKAHVRCVAADYHVSVGLQRICVVV